MAALCWHLTAAPHGSKRVARVLDPCAGTGEPAAALAGTLGAESYGIELNAERAAQCRARLDHLLATSAFSVRLAHGAFSCLWLNPPYDTDDEERRLEHAFLTSLSRALCPGGVLVFIIPHARLAVSARYLAAHYTGFAAYRFPDPEFAAFRQRFRCRRVGGILTRLCRLGRRRARACVRCGSAKTRRDGQPRLGGQRWRGNDCRRRFTVRSDSAVAGRGFAAAGSALAVRWSVRDRLSYADGAAWWAERGLGVERTTVYRWGRRCLPLLAEAARRYRHAVGGRGRVDAPSCRLQGRWAYCYRASDPEGQGGDVDFRERRTAATAAAFCARVIAATGARPEPGVTDQAGGSPPARRPLRPAAAQRTAQYRNTGRERDPGHRQQRRRPRRGVKQLAAADLLTRGPALIQTRRKGCSPLTVDGPRPLRLATAGPQRVRASGA